MRGHMIINVQNAAKPGEASITMQSRSAAFLFCCANATL